MSKMKLGALVLMASLLCSAVLGGCGGAKKNNNTPSASSSTVSTASGGNSEGVPEDGGFKTVSYEMSKDKYRTFYEIFPVSG